MVVDGEFPFGFWLVQVKKMRMERGWISLAG